MRWTERRLQSRFLIDDVLFASGDIRRPKFLVNFDVFGFGAANFFFGGEAPNF